MHKCMHLSATAQTGSNANERKNLIVRLTPRGAPKFHHYKAMTNSLKHSVKHTDISASGMQKVSEFCSVPIGLAVCIIDESMIAIV